MYVCSHCLVDVWTMKSACQTRRGAEGNFCYLSVLRYFKWCVSTVYREVIYRSPSSTQFLCELETLYPVKLYVSFVESDIYEIGMDHFEHCIINLL